jgi:hypothetical protein
MEGVGEAIEAQGASKRNHMPAIDEAAPEAPLPLAELVEMHLGGVLVEPGRRLVLGLFYGDAIDMIDPLAGGIVLEHVGRSAELQIERGAINPRTGCAEISDGDHFRQFGNMGLRSGGAGVAFSDHHPADVIDDRLAPLIEALRTHVDDAGLPVRVLFEPDHLRNGGERIAGKNRPQEPAIGVAKIRDRIQRHVRHRLAEYDMEGEQIIDRACRVADGASEGVCGLGRKTRAGQRRIERRVAAVQGPRRRVTDRLAEAKVLEKPACCGLRLGTNGHSRVKIRSDRCNR